MSSENILEIAGGHTQSKTKHEKGVIAPKRIKKGVKKFRRGGAVKDDGYGFGDVIYPTMVSSSEEMHRIDEIKSLEIDSIKTLFVFQGVDKDTEIRISNVIILCNTYHIRANLSYTIKKRACGNYTGIVTTFTIDSAVNSSGHGVLLYVGPLVLIETIRILTECDIDTLHMNGYVTYAEL